VVLAHHPNLSRKAILLAGGAAFLGGLLLFSRNPYYRYVLELIFINLITVYGLNVVMGFAGQATVGHAALFGIGAYTSALLATNYGYPIVLSALIAIFVTLAAAVFVAVPSFKLGGIYLAVLTIAFNIIVYQLINNLDITNGSVGVTGIPSFLPSSVPLEIRLIVILMLAYVAFQLNRNIVCSFFVRELWAIRENETLAMSFGISTYWTKIIAFEISAVLAALGGLLYGHTILYISPETSSFFHSVTFVMMVIAGGGGTILGPIIGTVIFTILPEAMIGLDYYRQSIFGLLLIVIALLFPRGIYGIIDKILYERRGKSDANSLSSRSLSAITRDLKPLRKYTVLLSVESVQKRFGGVVALTNVTLHVMPNRVHAIIGPNGSGKTTLINTISGLYVPNEGDVTYEGESLVGMSCYKIARKGISRTFQNLNLLDEHTVMENVLLGLHPWWRGSLVHALIGTRKERREEQKRRAFCYEILGTLGIQHLAATRVYELAYGQRKLVEICRALASQPRLLLLDEPTSGLGPDEIIEFIEVLKRVVERGITIVIIEHHIDIVQNMADWVSVLDDGALIASGTYEEVTHNPRVIEAYLGEA
jgi:ABC-type branched-subunit amino acid transport system ATPase component/ABC-type branched-subunit amino acid transport system permease subunit